MENKELIDLRVISVNDLYDKLCTVLSFNEVIKLYKLLLCIRFEVMEKNYSRNKYHIC